MITLYLTGWGIVRDSILHVPYRKISKQTVNSRVIFSFAVFSPNESRKSQSSKFLLNPFNTNGVCNRYSTEFVFCGGN